MNGWNWRNLITFSISSFDMLEKSICDWNGRPGTAGTGFKNCQFNYCTNYDIIGFVKKVTFLN
jgi:hypothetical protein